MIKSIVLKRKSSLNTSNTPAKPINTFFFIGSVFISSFDPDGSLEHRAPILACHTVHQCSQFFSMYLCSVSWEEFVRKYNLLNMCTHTGTNHIKTWSGSCAGFQHASGLVLFLGRIERVFLTWKNKDMTF